MKTKRNSAEKKSEKKRQGTPEPFFYADPEFDGSAEDSFEENVRKRDDSLDVLKKVSRRTPVKTLAQPQPPPKSSGKKQKCEALYDDQFGTTAAVIMMNSSGVKAPSSATKRNRNISPLIVHASDSGVNMNLPKKLRNAAVYDAVESSMDVKNTMHQNFSEFRRKNLNGKHQKRHEVDAEVQGLGKIEVLELSYEDRYPMAQRSSSPEIVELHPSQQPIGPEDDDGDADAKLYERTIPKNVAKEQTQPTALPKRRLFQTPDEPLGTSRDSEFEECKEKEKQTKKEKDVYDFDCDDEFSYREEEQKQKRGRKKKQQPPKIGSVHWMLNRMTEMEKMVKKPELPDAMDSDEISVVPDSLPISMMRMESSESEEAPPPDDSKEKVAVEMKPIEWLNKFDSPSDLQSTQAARKRRKKASTKGPVENNVTKKKPGPLPGLEKKSSQPPVQKTTPKVRPITEFFTKEPAVAAEKEAKSSTAATAAAAAIPTIDLSLPQAANENRWRRRSSLNRHQDDEEWAELERQETAMKLQRTAVATTSSASPAIAVDFEFERPKPLVGGGGIVHAKAKKVEQQASNDENQCPPPPHSPAPISDAEFRKGVNYQLVETPKEGSEERKRLDKEIDALSAEDQLTAAHINYLLRLNKSRFERIRAGKRKCERHERFHRSRVSRRELDKGVPLGFYKREQIQLVIDVLRWMLMMKKPDELDYMQRVLLPEALIMLMRIVRGFDQQQAEAYIQANINKVKVNSLDYV